MIFKLLKSLGIQIKGAMKSTNVGPKIKNYLYFRGPCFVIVFFGVYICIMLCVQFLCFLVLV